MYQQDLKIMTKGHGNIILELWLVYLFLVAILAAQNCSEKLLSKETEDEKDN